MNGQVELEVTRRREVTFERSVLTPTCEGDGELVLPSSEVLPVYSRRSFLKLSGGVTLATLVPGCATTTMTVLGGLVLIQAVVLAVEMYERYRRGEDILAVTVLANRLLEKARGALEVLVYTEIRQLGDGRTEAQEVAGQSGVIEVLPCSRRRVTLNLTKMLKHALSEGEYVVVVRSKVNNKRRNFLVASA